METYDLTIIRGSQKHEPIEVLYLYGSLDAHSFEMLDVELEGFFSKRKFAVIIVMSDVTHISSAGVGALLAATLMAKKFGGNLVLVAPSEAVVEVFKLLGLLGPLVIAPDLAAAKRCFNARRVGEALRDEWTQWHLTPSGWRRGSVMRHPDKFTEKPVPPDRLVTFTYSEYQRAEGSPVTREMAEDWRDTNAALVNEFLEVHGPCPQSL